MPLQIPPLRKRTGDIPLLVSHIIKKFNERLKKSITGIADEALAALEAHNWPGNIRELENVLERTILFCKGDRIERADLQLSVPPARAGRTSRTTSRGAMARVVPTSEDEAMARSRDRSRTSSAPRPHASSAS